jgi:hypothetical protein
LVVWSHIESWILCGGRLDDGQVSGLLWPGNQQRHPQYANARLQKALQQEWQFMQRVVPNIRDDIRDEFSDVEDALVDLFLLALFTHKFDKSKNPPLQPCQMFPSQYSR